MVGTPIERIPFTVLVFRWFAIVFYLFWEFVFGGIVQGQIVDAFSELRDEANAKEDDFNSNCLICSIASTTLERIGNGFVDHRDVSAALFAFICVSFVCFLFGSQLNGCVLIAEDSRPMELFAIPSFHLQHSLLRSFWNANLCQEAARDWRLWVYTSGHVLRV